MILLLSQKKQPEINLCSHICFIKKYTEGKSNERANVK